MKTLELRQIIKEEIKNTLKENKNISDIVSFISSYASKKDLDFEKTDTISKTSQYGSKTTYYIYSLGDKYGIIIEDSKVAGAGRLNDLVIIGGIKKGPKGLTNVFKLPYSNSTPKIFTEFLDKITSL
jgi:hypothetical protein